MCIYRAFDQKRPLKCIICKCEFLKAQLLKGLNKMTECGFNASAFLIFHRDYGCDVINYIIELKLKRAHLHILGTICEKFN